MALDGVVAVGDISSEVVDMLYEKMFQIATLASGIAVPNAHALGNVPPPGENQAAAQSVGNVDSRIVDSRPQHTARTTHIEVGLRIGYGVPMGSISDNVLGTEKLSDTVSGQVPIGIDLGYQVTRKLTLGLYGQYAFGIVGGKLGETCERVASTGLKCSASDLRIGVHGQYHFLATEKLNPWVGLGVGYEWLWFGFDSPNSSGTVSAKGVEFASVQAGLDYQLTPVLGIGPFASFTLGQFSSKSTSGGTAGLSGAGDIAEKAMHEWVTVGLRGAYRL